jgi:riboflavin synthase
VVSGAVFTGLVQDLGTVAALERTGDGVRLTVYTGLAAEVKTGDSIAVNGVCLTATEVHEAGFSADVMHATLERSSLGQAAPGGRVNLELSLRVGDRLGGHIVQGHVDAVGEVAAIADDGFARRVTIAADDDAILRYIVGKGSIAVDGVSLTVAELDSGSFTVSLIPETLERTNLGTASVGTPVNLEVDVLAKYVERAVGAMR